MSRFELRKFPTPEALAERAAQEFLTFIQGSTASQKSAVTSVALSGGRIAGTFFDAVSRLASGQPNQLDSIEYFWGDERCVPPTDSESNFRLAFERMLKPLQIPERRIHRIKGELEPAIAAAEAEKELGSVVGGTRDALLDLVLLGMGEDGHVASLFPTESAESRNNPAVYRAVIGPKPPPSRITLGYGAIAAARHVWVLASGKGKTDALQKSLAQDGLTPLAEVLRRRRHTQIFADFI